MQIKRHAEDDSTRLIRVWTVNAVTPFEKGIVWLQSGTSGIWHNYFYLRGVRQQNRDLQQQIQQMQLEQVGSGKMRNRRDVCNPCLDLRNNLLKDCRRPGDRFQRQRTVSPGVHR